MSPAFKSFLKGLLEKNKDKRCATPPAPHLPSTLLYFGSISSLHAAPHHHHPRPRLDWPALADHPFIADCDALAPVVYLPGAVEYSQLQRVIRTTQATAPAPVSSSSASAAEAGPKSTSASGAARSSSATARPQLNAQQQQQQQQYMRAGSPSEGAFSDVLQYGGGSKGAGMPLSEVVSCGLGGGGGGGGGGVDDGGGGGDDDDHDACFPLTT
jgi:hypothetical protein